MRKSEGIPLIGWGKSLAGVTQFHHQVKFAAAGENHLIYITSNHEIYGLGSNKFGQLGIGTTLYNEKPQRLTNVELICSPKIKNVYCGAQHTFFINQKNEVFSVGLNLKGQLGLGHFQTIKQPKLVVSLLPNGQKNKKCLNPSIIKQPKPPIIDVLERFDLQVKMDEETLQNILMLNDEEFVQVISCGALFTLALSNKGRVFGCGFQGTNVGIQSSDDFLQKSKFRQIQLNTKIVNISAGLSGAAALNSEGKAYIWGKFGKRSNNVPKIIEFEQKMKQNKLVEVQVGDQFAIMLTSRGQVLSFGYNIDNQLGVQSKDEAYREKATQIPKIPFCNKIYIGRNNCFAISIQKNQVFGWGSNRFGQLSLRENQPLIMNPKSLQFCIDRDKQQRLIPSSFCTYALSHSKIQFGQKKLFAPVEEVEEQQQQMIKLSQYRKLLNDYQTLKALNLNLLEKMQPKRKQNKQSQTSSKFQVSGITKHRKFDSNLQIQWKELTVQQKINEGGYGIIYRAKWRETTVAVKKFKIQNGDVSLRDFLSECHAMQAVRHPNIVLFLGAVIKSPNYCIVLEYCQKGSLWNYLQNTDVPLPWQERRRIAIQIARGTLYLHLCDPPILHRDLKSLNIFLDSNYRIKIGDFGWTKTLEEYMTNKIGTYQWMAPQVIGNQPYTQKADVFSYSIILWEIASREPPYRNISGTKVSEAVLNNQLRPNIPKKTPQPFAKLMKRCWDRQPNNRPNFRQIIKELQIMKL